MFFLLCISHESGYSFDALLAGWYTHDIFVFGEERDMMSGIPFLENIGDMTPGMAADLSFFFMFCGLSLAIGVFFGRFKLINILINAYIALAFIAVFPREIYEASPYAKGGIFLAILVFLTAIDKRLFDLHISSAGTDFFWRLIVMSLLVSGMLSSIILSLIPRAISGSFVSEHIFLIFSAPVPSVLWLAAPILVLLFINNRLK